MYLGGQPATPAAKDAMSVLRLLPSGAPEPSWGTSGAVTVALPAGICALGDGECFVSAMSPKVGGRMTLCASRGDGVTVRELFTSGVEDRNFDLTTPASVLSRCTAIVNNTPSDAFAAGARDTNVFAIVHLITSPTGGPQMSDPKFGPVVVPAEAGLGAATRLAIGGPSLLVASADATPGGAPSQIALARMNVFSSKQLDTTFGGGKGYVTTPIGTTPGFSRALVVQGDGRVIVAGTNGDMVAVRYWP